MDSMKPPGPLKLTGNVDANWRAFKQRFQLYVSAVGLDSKPDERKIAMLLTTAGPEALEVYNTFTFEMEEENKLDVVLRKFDGHCLLRKNETFERYVFRSRMQQQDESFDSYLTDLKIKAASCNFGVLRDSLIRDQIVFGTKDGKTREKLLRETDLTLETAVKICQASEMAGEHAKTFAEREQGAAAASYLCEAVDAVSIRGKHPAKFKNRNKNDGTFSCKRCGSDHKPKQCPAFGKTCSKCRGLHHFARMCMSKDKKVHTVQNENDSGDQSDDSDSFFISMVNKEDVKEPSKKNADISQVRKADKWDTDSISARYWGKGEYYKYQ